MEYNVTINSGGFDLKGNLQIPEKNRPCIIMLHGFTADKDLGFWKKIAKDFNKENFGCLRFNFRGCGEGKEKSQGSFMDTTLTSRIKDYKSAIDFVKNSDKINTNKLGVFGHSLGGMVAICARENRISSIITMGTPYKVPRFDEPKIPKKVGEHYELPSGRKFKKEFYEDIKKYDLGKDIQKTPPIRIIHGSSDEVVPTSHAKKLYKNAKEPKSLNIISNADHLFSNKDTLAEATRLSVEWFKKYLG